MAKKRYEESNIQAIATAIRSKTGSQDTYKVSEMAEAINAIVVDDGRCPRSNFQSIYINPSENGLGFETSFNTSEITT